ncbi:MAG: hypothetical protein MOB07_15635, partial [Acidobacteria bacterium]|nr:hypothetical protein [Acidobacteriota bacterium]
ERQRPESRQEAVLSRLRSLTLPVLHPRLSTNKRPGLTIYLTAKAAGVECGDLKYPVKSEDWLLVETECEGRVLYGVAFVILES